MRLVKWLGLPKVVAFDTDALDGATGAYVNVVGIASNKRVFRAHEKCKLAEMGLTLQWVEDVETFENRISRFHVSEESEKVNLPYHKSGAL